MIEVQEWLAEIKALKQQLASAHRAIDTANDSAANWRQLYATEAEQLRNQTQLTQQQIAALKAQIQQLQDSPGRLPNNPAAVEAVEQEVAQLQTVAVLQAKLKQALIERSSLAEALKTEQANHAQTRKSLTTIISDTIDRIAKDREASQNPII